MQFDVLGCVRNTQVPLQAAFHPVFEAVVNSIHSTQDKFGEAVAKLGHITVQVHRVQQQSTPGTVRPPVLDVTHFTITDNGSGFTDKNIGSFETAHSTAKADRGAKGLGRFSWLVLCRSAVIESTFEVGQGKKVRRTFRFQPTAQGIEDFKEEALGTEHEARTIIRLEGIHSKYADAVRKTSQHIAERLFEQAFGYLVLGQCPKIHIVDELPDGTDRIDMADKLAELRIEKPVDLRVGEHVLQVQHVQQPYKSDRHHNAFLCAHHRVVTSFPLSQVSELRSAPTDVDGSGPMVHHVFVSGTAFDDRVDNTRTRLDLGDDDSLFAHAGGLDMKTLRSALGQHVNEHFGDALKKIRAETFQQIQDHIRTTQPEYRHLLKRVPDQIERLEWVDNPRQVDEMLYRVQQNWEAEVRRQQSKVEEVLDSDKADVREVAEELSRVIAQVNEAGQANLVRYVAKRHAVLSFMQKLITKRALEAHVHRIVFPMRKTLEDVAYEDHNLWLLDDTLSFYDFLASDMTFADAGPVPVDSERRPDILAFKTGDPPFQHVALVEFKRPERKDENPIQQLVDYALLLRDGGAKAADGTSLPGIPRQVRIDGYAVATLTPTLLQKVRSGPGNMTQVEGDWRWHGGIPTENLTLELVDFKIFVSRALQRNRAFFTKLGLP
jgi:hypothetical protein